MFLNLYIFQGKIKSQASDEYIQPNVVAQVGTEWGGKLSPPACSADIRAKEIAESLWFEKVIVSKGGAAGKGPDPPEPPAMSVDGSQEYPNMAEEVDGGEVEGKTKMAFAKMQVPHPFKEQFLLQDEDFKLKTEKDEDESASVQETVSSGTSFNGAVEDAAAAVVVSGGGSKKSSRATTPGAVTPTHATSAP